MNIPVDIYVRYGRMDVRHGRPSVPVDMDVRNGHTGIPMDIYIHCNLGQTYNDKKSTKNQLYTYE